MAEMEDFEFGDGFADDDATDQVTQQEEDRLKRLEENQRKLAKKLHADEERERVESEIQKFYGGASELEKELAEVFLEGAETPTQVERAIAKIKAKAGAKAQAEADEEDAATSAAFTPPIAGTPPKQKTKFEVMRERALAGDKKAQFETFMALESKQGLPEEEKSLGELLGF